MNTAIEITNLFESFRMEPTKNDVYETVGKPILIEKLQQQINTGKPIEFVMLGLPFKSTNTRDKVLGIIPDLGEQLTLDNFQNMNNIIKQVYSPGAIFTVVSDGYVFNDVLKVSDHIVAMYGEIVNDMAHKESFEMYTLNDFYSGHDLVSKREKVMNQFGITAQKLESEILYNPDVNSLYMGMIRFMMEELTDKPFVSKNQLQKGAKLLTREMMFRNEAYSNLVKQEFPNHIRVSMHPSTNSGAKYSIKLIPGNDTKHSAWHSVVICEPDGTYRTAHKKDAIEQGYGLVHKDNLPYAFAK